MTNLELEDTVVTSQLYALTYGHHDLYAHEALVFYLNANLYRLLQSSTQEGEMLCVIATQSETPLGMSEIDSLT